MQVSGFVGMSILQLDDPGEGGTNTLNPDTGDGVFTWNWAPCCTDGVAFGYVQQPFCGTLQVDAVQGIEGWLVLDGSGDTVAQIPDLTTPIEICGQP